MNPTWSGYATVTHDEMMSKDAFEEKLLNSPTYTPTPTHCEGGDGLSELMSMTVIKCERTTNLHTNGGNFSDNLLHRKSRTEEGVRSALLP